VTAEQARVLARGTNIAVTQLEGAIPGIHVQGATFFVVVKRLMDAAGRLRHVAGDHEASEELDDAVKEMTEILRFYESVLGAKEIRLPYGRADAGLQPAGVGAIGSTRRSGQRRSRHRRRAAVAAVAAYLADEDADVYNVTDAGVKEDALAAALNLTALASAAVAALAAATGRDPQDVLLSVDQGTSA